MNLPTYTGSLDLPASASWPESRHVFDERQNQALRAAEATGRPLLVRGEPGTGKSQLAHAAAVAAGRRFVPFVVDSRTEPTDLLWRYDAVARLADAQLTAVDRDSPDAALPRDPRRYLTPGPLWWAFDWQGAEDQRSFSRVSTVAPDDPSWNLAPGRGTVLLIDEIDKAEAELPNGLLEALGNGRFSVPQAGLTVSRRPGLPAPLVIVTSNEERELPAAFLRRCLVLTLSLPPEGMKLLDYLVGIARVHFGAWAQKHKGVVHDAAQMLEEDRASARESGLYRPGLAEYLDLLRALQGLGGPPDVLLEVVRGFAYRKQRPGPD